MATSEKFHISDELQMSWQFKFLEEKASSVKYSNASECCLIQHLAKTGSLPHLYVPVMQMEENLSIISRVCDFTDIHLKRMSALRIGQIAVSFDSQGLHGGGSIISRH